MTKTAPDLPRGYRLVAREKVGSTNDEAKALARNGAGAGTLVWAREQTAGRGRHGRSWASPPGNLYVSVIVRPDCPPHEAAQLGFVAGVAIADALAEIAPAMAKPACKWPNDILVGGRKIAGILLESEIDQDGRLRFLIVGIGLNLASAPAEAAFAATSVADEGVPVPAPQAALASLARHFERWFARWRGEGFAPVREAWRARAFALGEEIRVRLETETLRGRFADLDQHGALLLEIGGERRRIFAGDVFPAR
jgi:BirA family biotin operon repressor/biotin-[acetyl-CoA-carboxylase] ligase